MFLLIHLFNFGVISDLAWKMEAWNFWRIWGESFGWYWNVISTLHAKKCLLWKRRFSSNLGDECFQAMMEKLRLEDNFKEVQHLLSHTFTLSTRTTLGVFYGFVEKLIFFVCCFRIRAHKSHKLTFTDNENGVWPSP